MSSTIITKVVIPSRRPTLLQRPRLVDFIHDHIDRKLILISAGAGYGKTSLLVDYAHDTDLPVCWFSLDEADRDLRIFLDYLILAIQQRFPQFGERSRELLQSSAFPIDLRAIVGAVVSDIYNIPDYFVIALDDFHLMDQSEEVNQFLDSFLYHLPENCHLILSSRTLPTKLTMTRLVARQEVAGLGVSELRFTAQEIQELMRQNYGIELSDTQAEELARQSEGWITGILLTTHDLWGGLFKDIIRVQGDEGQVFAYLASEVFARQPPELQRFLVYSSVLDRMNPQLCDALLGETRSGEILRFLERQNLFTVQLEANWYRYHHLFRAFLAARGREQDAEQYRALQVKAGHLLADQGLWNEAIEHYLAAEAWEDAARAVHTVAREVWDRGQWTTLARWIDVLPSNLLDLYPDLSYFRGKLYLEMGDFGAAASSFDRARVAFAHQGNQGGIARTLVEEGVICWYRGNTEKAIENSRRALSILGEEQSITVGRAYRGLGTAYILQGDFANARKNLQQALALYERLDRPYDIALVYHDLGVVYERMGNLPLAVLHFEQALKYWRRVHNLGSMANTLNSLGVAQHRQGKYAEALDTLEDAQAKAKQAGTPRTQAYILASLGDLYRDLHDFERALSAYEEALEIGKRREEAFIVTYSLLAIGDIYCCQGDLEAASYYVEQAMARAERYQSRYDLALCKLAQGILLCKRGDLKASEEILVQVAETFRADGAKGELAKAYLHLANVALLQKRPAFVEQCLQIVADLARELQNWQFIVAEGRNLPQVIQYGARQKIGGGFFREVSYEIRKLARVDSKSLRGQPTLPETHGIRLLEIYAFGPSRVVKDGHTITNAEWNSSVTKELFFFLLSFPQGLRKEEIIEAFWPGTSLSKGNSNFHSTTHRLRRALYKGCLVREDNVYRLLLDVPYSYDVAEFQDLVSEAKEHPDRMEECYRKAIELYKGDYMADTYASWCEEQRERLRDEYLRILLELSAHYSQQGRYEESIALSKKALAYDSYREEIYRQIMQCYALAGNRAAAIKCYHDCAKTLKEELGVEPELETIALYQQILSGLWDRPQA